MTTERRDDLTRKIQTLPDALSLLQTALNEAGLSASEVARRLGVDRAILSRWISGQKVPSLERYLQLMQALGYTLQGGPGNVDQQVTETTPPPVEVETAPKPPNMPSSFSIWPDVFFSHRPHFLRSIAIFVREGHPEGEALSYYVRVDPNLTLELVRYAVKNYRGPF